SPPPPSGQAAVLRSACPAKGGMPCAAPETPSGTGCSLSPGGRASGRGGWGWHDLAKQRLIKTAQLARVQTTHLAAQQFQRRNAYVQMLGHRPLIEGPRRPRQLQLAVQRLVRHAQQGAVGNPQPVALG